MRISDWSSDVCSSDLGLHPQRPCAIEMQEHRASARIRAQVAAVFIQPRLQLRPFLRRQRAALLARDPARSEERRVGTEGVRTCRSRWSPDHYNKNTVRITKRHT